MPQLVITASPGLVADQDTNMFIIPLINGVPPVINGVPTPEIDGEQGPVSLTVNVGDTYDVAQQDKNVVGLSGISPHVTGTIPAQPPTSVPQTPGAPTVAVTFP
jgi:hypothetical protein